MSRIDALYPIERVAGPDADEQGLHEDDRTTEGAAFLAADDVVMTDARVRLLPRVRIDAFVTSDDLARTVGDVAADRRAVRAEIVLHRGGFKQAIAHYREHSAPHLIVVDDQGVTGDLEADIAALANHCPPSCRLVVVGERNDVALYRRLIQIGASDYLVQPIRPLELLGCISSIFDDVHHQDLGSVLAFIGARGGVGSSTVAHNVAASLSRVAGSTTLLIDADAFGTAALQFDFTTSQGFADAVKEGEALDCETLERLIHWRDRRFGILSAPDKPDGGVAPHGGTVRHLIEQARRMAQFVVVDLPHGWTPWIAEALAASDRLGLVATPDLPSLRNSRTLLEMIQKIRTNDQPPDIILNRIPIRGKPLVSTADYARVLGQKMAAALPFDAAFLSAEMSGRVLVEETPGSPAAKAIGVLAEQLAGRDMRAARKSDKKSLLGRLLRGKS